MHETIHIPDTIDIPDAMAECAGLGGFRPPAVLYVRGSPAALRAPLVAIVGSRDCDSYGEAVAERLGRAMARAGVVVVSGGARGVDIAAQRGALVGGGRSIAVLAGGVDRLSPATSRPVLEAIAAGAGAVLSRHPPGTRPAKGMFLARNALIASLAQMVVVVAAGFRSGALNTAKWARAFSRPTFAVPGDVCCLDASGTNALIRDGHARLLTHPDELLRPLGLHTSRFDWPEQGRRTAWLPGGWAPSREVAPTESPPATQLDEVERRVLQLVREGGDDIEQLVHSSGLSRPGLMAALGGLEAEGWVMRLPGQRVTAAPCAE